MSHIRNEPFTLTTHSADRASQGTEGQYNRSIWQGERSTNAFFSDDRASRVGDVITVRIAEVMTSKEKATTDLKRTGRCQSWRS
jgi:flagellar basal body L-ring protein FlgH